MTFLLERQRWLVLLVLPILTLALATNVILPTVAYAKAADVAEGGSPGGGEGDPEEWGSPRQGAVFLSNPPRYQFEVSFWRTFLSSLLRWTRWV